MIIILKLCPLLKEETIPKNVVLVQGLSFQNNSILGINNGSAYVFLTSNLLNTRRERFFHKVLTINFTKSIKHT